MTVLRTAERVFGRAAGVFRRQRWSPMVVDQVGSFMVAPDWKGSMSSRCCDGRRERLGKSRPELIPSRMFDREQPSDRHWTGGRSTAGGRGNRGHRFLGTAASAVLDSWLAGQGRHFALGLTVDHRRAVEAEQERRMLTPEDVVVVDAGADAVTNRRCGRHAKADLSASRLAILMQSDVSDEEPLDASVSFEKAGPRQKLFFDPRRRRRRS